MKRVYFSSFCLLAAALSLPGLTAAQAEETAAVDAVVEEAKEVVDDAAQAAEEVVDQAADAATEVTEDAKDAAAELLGGAEDSATADDGFESEVDRLSYAIGVDLGNSFRSQDVEINPEMMAEALTTVYSGGEARLNEDQCIAVIERFQNAMQEKMMKQAMEAQQTAILENTAAAEAFMAENKAKEGVVETESGLQYVITEAAEGALPKADDMVTLHYEGKLLDGTVFDSSIQRGQPATFPVGGVIPGFAEGLQLLPVGSKGTLFIPGELAYGPTPPPGSNITPMAMLIFDVEIISVESPKSTELEALGD